MIHVAVAVIVNAQQQVLIALRQSHQHQGGLWEFPGGKVEAKEQVEAALCREVKEEVNLVVEAAQPMTTIEHDYKDKTVLLDVWLVTAFSGQIQGNEGQKTHWCPISEIDQFAFPDANAEIITQLKANHPFQ